MPTTHKNCQHSNINSLHVVGVAPFWNVLFLYGHCPNCSRSPPSVKRANVKKFPKLSWQALLWANVGKSASLRLNDISWYDLWNLLCNQMEISHFFHFWLWLLFHILCGFASRQLLQTNCFFLIDMNKKILSEHTPFRISSKGGCQINCHQNHHHHRIIVNSKILIKVPLQKAGMGWLGGLGMSL